MKKLFLILFFCCCAVSVRAEFDCSKKPTCEGLGYVHKNSAKCTGQAVLRCPFDANYVFCGEDTVELNCQAGMYFDEGNRFCYKDDTVSDYVFIKYNDIQTKAFLLSLSGQVTKSFSTYSEALGDNLAHLLTREMFDSLAGTDLASSSVLNKCVRVRNGKNNEIVRANTGVVTEDSFSSVCGSNVTAYYYTKAILY